MQQAKAIRLARCLRGGFAASAASPSACLREREAVSGLAGSLVLNQPFFASDNVATAGGCFASPYLAAWIIARTEGWEVAKSALHYVAPVGEKEAYVSNAFKRIAPYIAR